MSSLAVGDLRQWIDAQPRLLSDEWVGSLEPRKRDEAVFHDHDRVDGRDLVPTSTPNRRFYEAADLVRRHIAAWMAERAPGTMFLDYACGNGLWTLAAAQAGAALAVGIDLSPVSLEGAQQRAEAAGVAGRTRFLQRDCEDTGFPDQSFDACLCSGMLHHLDLTRAFAELHRIMRAGGRILCSEALAYNPIIQLYRRLTPQLRTPWETDHILSMKQVHMAERWFRVENVRFHLMAAPLATLLPAGAVRRAGLTLGHAIDAVATRVPGLRLWSWQFSFELVKHSATPTS
ncbi:MAG: class I SAM-dependent methyltransferase [Gemmatimonadales bacterium]